MSEEVFDFDDEDVAIEKTVATDSGIIALSKLVEDAKAVELELARLTDAAKEAQSKLDHICKNQIPELMDHLGIRGTIKTTSGLEVTVKDKLKASITEATRSRALAWLKEHNFEKLIKNEFKLTLRPEQADDADSVREHIESRGLVYKNKQFVEPQTLAKFVRDQRKEGVNVPVDVFNVYDYREATIK